MKTLKALLIIDMQNESFTPEARTFDADGVVHRINELAWHFRHHDFPVIHIQHDGTGTGEYERDTHGWKILDAIVVHSSDIVISKTANDAFYQTELKSLFTKMKINELYISGSATDFCIDSTVQSALAKDYMITVVADGHTTGDKPHLSAKKIIEHYNLIWQNLIPTKGKIEVKNFDLLKKSDTSVSH
jgi:nicotinamidase-related amidase